VGGSDVFGEELHLLRHAALDDLVIFVQAHRQRFPIKNLLAHPVIHHVA
jgi:hypothetical protein